MSDQSTPPPASTVDEPNDDDLRTLLAKRQHAKPTKATWILLALIAVATGFALGACTQGALSSALGESSPPSAVLDNSLGTAPDATVGSVASIDGDTMIITTRSGEDVTVTVPEAAQVTSSVEVPLAEIPVGATVIVRGAAGSDGAITADSISEGIGVPGGRGLQ